MRNFLIIMLLLSVTSSAFSEGTNPLVKSKGTLKGFVIDVNVNQPLEYATISMVNKVDNKVVNGTITDETGFFKIKNIDFGTYKVNITFIGYKTKSIESVSLKSNNDIVDLGQISLDPAVEILDEAVIVADRPTMTYKIDKKIINVSQQHTSASGTAVEILENIPSVTVDIEGNVSLRGSDSFTVLIDNKPSLLDPSDALNQIPASSIENIEIITNPSAKYDPDGTAGIINIILKKSKLQGVSGVVNTNYGSHNSMGGDFLLSFRKEKLNFYIGADYNNRVMEGESIKENMKTKNDTSYYVFSDGDMSRDRVSSGIRGGIDFNLNALNSLSIGVRYGERSRGKDSYSDYREWISPDPTSFVSNYKNESESENAGDYYSVNIDYVHKFLKKGHLLIGQFVFDSEDSEDTDITELMDVNTVMSSGQKSIEKEPEKEYRIKLDYTLPIGDKNKFEAGYQGRLKSSDSENEMYLYNTMTGNYDFMTDFSHKVDSKNNIHALYSIYSSELGNFGYQLGLRGEYVDREISMVGENQDYTLNRVDLFPTIHLSYNFIKDIQMMTSYTRRIKRPRSWYLEPFITWSDAYNVRMGNPALDPEYIDSYELSFQKKYERNLISVDAYYRMTNNKIERVKSVYEDYNNVYLSSVENVGKDYSFGTEIMFAFDAFKWWHLDLMANVYNYKVEGQLFDEDFSKESFNWNVRFNNLFKITKSTRLQLNMMYDSPTATAQGESEGGVMASLALKQDFFKNKLSATLQIRDLLNTAGHDFRTEGSGFYTYREFSPHSPMCSITLTYRINNYKKDRKHRSNSNAGMNDLGGEEF